MKYHGLKGVLKVNEPLAKYTSWRVGGIARQLYRPTSVADLSHFLSQLPRSEPLLWLGLGSNLLIRDGGFAGTVISMTGLLQTLTINETEVVAEAGMYCSRFAKQTAKAGLGGSAFFAGIPGTLGGALAMNAGAHGSQTWEWVNAVQTINRDGEIQVRNKTDFEVGYRTVRSLKEEWFVSVSMTLPFMDAQQAQDEIKALLKQRNASQPANQPCAGSVFKNPEQDFAGRLIEASQLKGLSIGGAQVSEKHANFIINTGNATAADIEALILVVQQKTKLAQGVELEPEIHIVGEPA